jgi:hypothetical protein
LIKPSGGHTLILPQRTIGPFPADHPVSPGRDLHVQDPIGTREYTLPYLSLQHPRLNILSYTNLLS